MKRTSLKLFLLLALAVSAARGDASGLQSAFEQLDPAGQAALNALGSGLLGEMKGVSECLISNATPDICNFNASFDPLYYYQKCFRGTLLQPLIEDALRKIPVAGLPTGIPREVSHQRCDQDIFKPKIEIPGLGGKSVL